MKIPWHPLFVHREARQNDYDYDDDDYRTENDYDDYDDHDSHRAGDSRYHDNEYNDGYDNEDGGYHDDGGKRRGKGRRNNKYYDSGYQSGRYKDDDRRDYYGAQGDERVIDIDGKCIFLRRGRGRS